MEVAYFQALQFVHSTQSQFAFEQHESHETGQVAMRTPTPASLQQENHCRLAHFHQQNRLEDCHKIQPQKRRSSPMGDDSILQLPRSNFECPTLDSPRSLSCAPQSIFLLQYLRQQDARQHQFLQACWHPTLPLDSNEPRRDQELIHRGRVEELDAHPWKETRRVRDQLPLWNLSPQSFCADDRNTENDERDRLVCVDVERRTSVRDHCEFSSP